MKIGVDLTKFSQTYSGGVATFAIGLTQGIIRSAGLGDQIVVLATTANKSYLVQRFSASNFAIVVIDESAVDRYVTSALNYLGFATRIFVLSYLYDRIFRSAGAAKIDAAVDVLIAPMTTLGITSCTVPTILCVHDIQHEYLPEFFSFRERAARWSRYRVSCWAATVVQASSRFIKTCLLEKFEFLQPEKIFVASEGVDFDAFNPDSPMKVPAIGSDIITGTFLFYPAQLWPHKNHLLLIDALAAFRDKKGYELPCLLTGQDCGMLQVITAAIERVGLSQVRYLGKVPFSQLLWLYSNCRAVLALGLHESSSLPLREGAVFGKPLICTDIPPNEELKDDLYILPFARHSSVELLARLEEVVIADSSITEEAAENKMRVGRFAWEEIAMHYITIARGLVSDKEPRAMSSDVS